MSLPAHRRLSHGRTHSQSWDALDYACPVKGYRPAVPVAPFARVLAIICGAALLVPLIVHAIARFA